MNAEAQRRIVLRYHSGWDRPRNPELKNPNYFCNDADVWQSAASRALGLGPAERFTSKVPASQWHLDGIMSSCVALRMNHSWIVTQEFARLVMERGRLPRTKGDVYELLAAKLAEAYYNVREEQRRTDKKANGPWFDWEKYAHQIHDRGGLFTPIRCMLLALRAWHIYRFRRWRRLAKAHKAATPPLEPWPDRSPLTDLVRRSRAKTMLAYWKATNEGRFPGRWPWNVGYEQNVAALVYKKLPDWKMSRSRR